MDDVEADQRGERESDRDGGGVDVEGQLTGGCWGFHEELLCLVWGGEKIGLRCTKPTLLGSFAWAFELEGEV